MVGRGVQQGDSLRKKKSKRLSLVLTLKGRAQGEASPSKKTMKEDLVYGSTVTQWENLRVGIVGKRKVSMAWGM